MKKESNNVNGYFRKYLVSFQILNLIVGMIAFCVLINIGLVSGVEWEIVGEGTGEGAWVIQEVNNPINVYSMHETKDEATSPGTLAIFLNGIDVHNKHQRFLKDTNILVGSEKTYYSEFLDMYATPDAISNFLGRTIIIEYKSMRTELFYSLKEVPYNAFCQSQIYMYMTGIPDAIVVVENKNDQVLKVYTIVFDLRFALNVIRHRLKIIECLREKYIPIDKRLCSKPTKKCKYSEYCFNTKMIKKIEQRIK